ncbi:MAG: hypothetical protein HYR86_11670 [Candidatus Rokubacteria bacterium]|nr:hypothetical protein [Candidatus Rokubacteria bacterium]
MSQHDLKLFDYLKDSFAGSETVEVILDRRRRQRRWRETIYPLDRRKADRRQRNIDAELQNLGWVLVRKVMSGRTDPGVTDSVAASLR